MEAVDQREWSKGWRRRMGKEDQLKQSMYESPIMKSITLYVNLKNL